MLEKIGLPPKPSLRGNHWVVDASHCQGCASQFTFINRKHHCRRCGGLFCGNCTSQRMFLRGQGDSPVRICDPCKKLEEASRFEMRHGHKTRPSRGSTKLESKSEDDDIVNNIFGNQGKRLPSSKISLVSTSDSSNSKSVGGWTNEEDDVLSETLSNHGRDLASSLPSSSSDFNGGQQESENTQFASPETLRKQALEEKQKHKILKKEGKNEEALKAFKRAKELERKAHDLELSERKQRRKLQMESNQDNEKRNNRVSVEKKDDILKELGKLGWSELDEDSSKKRKADTVEDELVLLMKEVLPNAERNVNKKKIEKSEVLVLKRKALALKREGKLAEAKEELKKAKLLEQKLEELELLGEDEASDDELSALIQSMDDDESGLHGYEADHGFDLNDFGGNLRNIGNEMNVDVTEDDLLDPDMAATLASLGWADDETGNSAEELAPPRKEKLLKQQGYETYEANVGRRRTSKGEIQKELLSLKRKSLALRREGKVDEAEGLLQEAKLLEEEIAQFDAPKTESQPQITTQMSDLSRISPSSSTSKRKLQQELLEMKRTALSHRRKGEIEEADKLLKKAQLLEAELEEIGSKEVKNSSREDKKVINNSNSVEGILGNIDSDANVEVTEADMQDPDIAATLSSLGWTDEISKGKINQNQATLGKEVSESTLGFEDSPATSQKSRRNLQQEILGLKRKALSHRRRGEVAQAEKMLLKAQELETELQSIDGEEPKSELEFSEQRTLNDASVDDQKGKSRDETMPTSVSSQSFDAKNAERINDESKSSSEISVNLEILAHKKKAIALKREGKLAEAKDELRKAKILEKNVAERSVSSSSKEPSPVKESAKPLSGRDRFKLQQECLSHKRQAMKLRNQGRMEEAESELQLAKALETQLEEATENQNNVTGSSFDGDVQVEDVLDPQLLSALKALGIDHTSPTSKLSKKEMDGSEKSSLERKQLEERIKAEKVKAVNLKRSGQQAEAMDALRLAKLFEKKLDSLAST